MAEPDDREREARVRADIGTQNLDAARRVECPICNLKPGDKVPCEKGERCMAWVVPPR